MKADSPEIKEMQKDLKKILTIDRIAESEGGKTLVKELTDDIVSSVDTLCSKYSSLTHLEFIAICADMKSKLDLTRVITRSKKNRKYLENLITETLQS